MARTTINTPCNRPYYLPLFYITLLTCLSTLSSAQGLSPRPVLEGYEGGLGANVLSKNPMVPASAWCGFIQDSGSVHGGLEGHTYSDNWPYSHPEFYTYDCAYIDSEGNQVVISELKTGKKSSLKWVTYGATDHSSNDNNTCPVGNPIDLTLGEKIQTEKDVPMNTYSPL